MRIAVARAPRADQQATPKSAPTMPDAKTRFNSAARQESQSSERPCEDRYAWPKVRMKYELGQLMMFS